LKPLNEGEFISSASDLKPIVAWPGAAASRNGNEISNISSENVGDEAKSNKILYGWGRAINDQPKAPMTSLQLDYVMYRS
jgi:hypothetical protein